MQDVRETGKIEVIKRIHVSIGDVLIAREVKHGDGLTIETEWLRVR